MHITRPAQGKLIPVVQAGSQGGPLVSFAFALLCIGKTPHKNNPSEIASRLLIGSTRGAKEWPTLKCVETGSDIVVGTNSKEKQGELSWGLCRPVRQL